jgi:glycosyltransferase involved in cell wall biosynthesis
MRERREPRTPPRTSVVIPAKDRVEKLERAIDTALAQTDSDLEVVVVDDGSESPLELVVGSRYQDPRLRFVRQDNTGPAGARNTGALAARGRYIAFLDSDDGWEPTKVERQVERFLARPELALVGTGVRFLFDDGTGRSEVRITEPGAPRVWELLQVKTPTVMFQRDAFVAVGGFSRDMFFLEDQDLFLRTGLRFPYEIIPEPLAIVYLHAQQTTRRAWKQLDWVGRYEHDIRTFARHVAPLMRPTEWRHLARKVSILEGDVAEMFAEHGARGRALRAQSIATLLSPLDLEGWRRLVKLGWPSSKETARASHG